jgi:hypothetical protein
MQADKQEVEKYLQKL